jgi:hypothetical protein
MRTWPHDERLETSPSSVGRIAGHRLAAEAGLWHPSSPAEKTRSGRGGRRMTSMPRRLGPCCLQIPGENAPTVGCHPKLRMAPRDSIIPLGGRRGPDRRRSFSGQAWSRYVSHPSTSCLLAWWRCTTLGGADHSAPLERVMNSIRNGLGMRETEIAKDPSRPWNPHSYAVFAQVHNTL